MLVQAVSGESFASFMRKHIFELVRLNQTRYLRTSVPQGSDASRGYEVDKGRFVVLPPFTMSWAAGAGAVASDVRDLIAWDNAFFGGRIINTTLVQIATTPSRVENDYAFGWAVDHVKGQRMVWHNGGLPGVHAMNAVFPQSGWQIVVLTNIYTANPEGIAKEFIGILSPRTR